MTGKNMLQRKYPHDARLSRRTLLERGALGALAFEIGGAVKMLNPAEARAQALPFAILTQQEADLVDALGRAVVSGADEAGLAHYLDHQLAADPGAALLMLRYMDAPPPYVDFYRSGLNGADALAQREFGRSMTALNEEEAHGLVGLIAGGNPPEWKGPPAALFYFVFRADAVDVTYGTVEGFERLGVPYVPHIAPPENW